MLFNKEHYYYFLKPKRKKSRRRGQFKRSQVYDKQPFLTRIEITSSKHSNILL